MEVNIEMLFYREILRIPGKVHLITELAARKIARKITLILNIRKRQQKCLEYTIKKMGLVNLIHS